MKKQSTQGGAMKFSVIFCFIAILGIVFLINACSKSNKQTTPVNQTNEVVANHKAAPVVQNTSLTQVVTVGDIRKSADGSYSTVYFHENEEIFTVQDESVIASLQNAYNSQKTIKITYNPWSATVLSVTNTTAEEESTHNSRQIVNSPGIYQRMANNIDPEVLNTPSMAILNETTPGLTNVVPDMATAQTIFDYISHQCCAIGGPILIDYCISFQYCEDGCYARAHKMCWIINNTFHYGTHKIFSFSVGSTGMLSNRLCVKAEKWKGCCVNWWYHVAPLVNINTPSGIKAYVFDPAMFDQPVLLATWLHAQQNPACAVSPPCYPLVTSFNIQPTASYSPMGDTSHFDTDPTYSSTNSTLVGYAPLKTCP